MKIQFHIGYSTFYADLSATELETLVNIEGKAVEIEYDYQHVGNVRKPGALDFRIEIVKEEPKHRADLEPKVEAQRPSPTEPSDEGGPPSIPGPDDFQF